MIKEQRKMWLPLVTFFLYGLLYTPIIVLIIFSFNKSIVPYTWGGFTLDWYRQLFHSSEVWQALKNSLFVASISVVMSVTMGLLCVYYCPRRYLDKVLFLFYGSLAAPEIVVAVSLLSFFVLFSIPLSITTLIASHTLLGLGYVVPIIHSRFVELDYRLTEASYDLGATQTQTFFKVIIPLLMPSLLSGALLVFVISLDDFILSFFCSGATAQTLPMYIFSVIRSGATPIVNALSTLLLLVSSLFVVVFTSLGVKTRMF